MKEFYVVTDVPEIKVFRAQNLIRGVKDGPSIDSKGG
jgi:hypothetical protein